MGDSDDAMASESVGEGNPVEGVGGEAHNVLFGDSGFVVGVSYKGKVESGELFLKLPTAIVGNGEMELEFGLVSPFIALG